MKSKSRNLVLLLVIGLVFPLILNYNFKFSIEDNTKSINCTTNAIQTPIFIDDSLTGPGAHNWTWAESQSWCSGSGTWKDPYVIEKLEISGLGVDDGIGIINSSFDSA